MEVDTKTIIKIIEIIRNNISIDNEISENTNMRKDIDIDSFDVLMIMNAIDDEYGISVEEEDFKQVNTPLEIVKLLSEKYGINGTEK